jgi:SAM-dependent methyltransferase
MNKNKIGAENVEFRLGEIEHLPLGDETVDVIISNCVINLSPDKAQVFREAYRVLKPGGRLAISDIVSNGPLPEAIKNDLGAWVGCIAGAMDFRAYFDTIRSAGFEKVEITPQYWGDETTNVTVGQPDHGLRNEMENVRKGGRSEVVVQDRVEGRRIDHDTAQDFDSQKAIFSAKIRAMKK